MRKIITTTFVTLDGVMQAPGGSDEDRAEGFEYGGWQQNFSKKDEIAEKELNKIMTTPFELLLGKKTYDIFAGYWPHDTKEAFVANPFNSTKKYVVSHHAFDMTWNNSHLVTGDVVKELQKLKEMDGPDLVVWGSSKLIQTMLKHNLIDQMRLWIYPITIGKGKKFFAEGTMPEHFKAVETKVTDTGLIIATYEPTEPLKKS